LLMDFEVDVEGARIVIEGEKNYIRREEDG
jgi:hypothetical protein